MTFLRGKPNFDLIKDAQEQSWRESDYQKAESQWVQVSELRSKQIDF